MHIKQQKQNVHCQKVEVAIKNFEFILIFSKLVVLVSI